MTNTIDLYLDFDGVINIIGSRIEYEDTKYDRCEGWNLEWRQSVIDFINELPDNVNLVWLSTWNHYGWTVNKLTPLLGITRPVSYIERIDGWWKAGWWKAYALDVYRSEKGLEDEPYVWIDDDLDEAEAWGRVKPNLGESLRISPAPETGITEDHMRLIEYFVRQHS